MCSGFSLGGRVATLFMKGRGEVGAATLLAVCSFCGCLVVFV